MKFIGTFILLLLFPLNIAAQKLVKYKQPRVLVLLDGSSSMMQPWNNKDARYKIAADIVSRIMDSVYKLNDHIEFGLRVYGHQSAVQENNCFDSKNEVMFSKKNAVQMFFRVNSIHPKGISPIAYSLKEAAEKDLVDEDNNAYTIILITDGGESCGGNICEVAKMLADRKIFFKPYIIGLVDYAPLQQQYECLGTYLLANNDKNLTDAIVTIASGYKNVFTKPIPVTLPVPVKKTPAPVIATPVAVPESAPQPVAPTQAVPENIETPARPARQDDGKNISLPASSIVLPAVTSPVATVSNTKNIPVTQPKPSTEIPDFDAIKPVNNTPAQLSKPVTGSPIIPTTKTIAVLQPKTSSMLPDFEGIKADTKTPVAATVAPPSLVTTTASLPVTAVRPAIPEVERLTTKAIKPLPVVTIKPPVFKNSLVVKYPPPSKTLVPDVPAPVAKAPAPLVAKAVVPTQKPTVKPTTPKAGTPPPANPVIKQIDAPFTTETVAAETTTLEVYFTDGKGKFYSTTPQMQLYDHKTGKPVKDFYRTTDEAGKPDPLKLEAGTYDLGYKDQPYILSGNIAIVANNKNKVTIRVVKGSIHFYYPSNPTRVVKEFNARVTRRFEEYNPTVEQSCKDILPYEAGNYYAEVNSLPITRYNLDVLFGVEVLIPVKEPGEVLFTNENAVGMVQLYHPLGDKYVHFHNLNIPGDTARQHLRLQPMMYEAHYIKNPKLPYAPETVVKFLVKSNETTSVVLP